MPRKSNVPPRPVAIYKRLIDDLVEETPAISSRLVIEEGIYSRALDAKAMNSFVQSLAPEQRQVLAEMLTEERRGGIHDTLARFTYLVDGELVFTYRGEPMPVQLSGMGLHGDYIGRLDGWEWPGDESHEA